MSRTLSPPSLINENLLLSPPIARVAGACLGALGFFVLGTAIQLVAIYDGVLPLLLTVPLWVLGSAGLIVAPQVYNARGWAAVLGTFVSVAAAVTSVVWMLYLMANLVFAPMILLGTSSSLLAVFVVPFAIGPAIQVSRARSALW